MQRLVQIKTKNKRLTTKQKIRIKSSPNTIYCDKRNNTYYWTSTDNPGIIIKNIFK